MAIDLSSVLQQKSIGLVSAARESDNRYSNRAERKGIGLSLWQVME